jgi:hypothetical protein
MKVKSNQTLFHLLEAILSSFISPCIFNRNAGEVVRRRPALFHFTINYTVSITFFLYRSWAQGQIILALKARRRTAQGASPGFGTSRQKSPVGAKQIAVPPLQGSIGNSFLTQGFGCCAAFTLGFAASHLRRSGEIDGAAINSIVTGYYLDDEWKMSGSI